MREEAALTAKRADLPVILIAAVLQGWAMFGLHRSIQNHTWPATHPAWLLGLYAVTIVVPITVELLAGNARARNFWLAVGALGLAYFYFGWHHGSAVAAPATGDAPAAMPSFLPLAFVMLVLWLLVLPFIQCTLAAGWLTFPYQALFAHAWRNKIALAEAALFTALLWLLLFLWQTLFHMLAIDFFRELFEKPIFYYPVTCIAFGCALHLIGAIDQLVSAVLAQILNVLKWLALVAGALLALFSVALLAKLPGLVFTGQRAIGAAWLLWLVAVLVLLLNAAYRDGTETQPYPRWIALALRVLVPLTMLISLTALFALGVRTQHYGLTVERVWAFVVAGAALIYSLGYSQAAVRRGPWLGGIARVNVLVALALIAVIAAALTPILSPYRLAADSQYRMVLAGRLTAPDAGEPRAHAGPPGVTPMHYLRFDTGNYGTRRLQQLAQLQDHPQAATIRELAAAELRLKSPWEAAAVLPAEQLLEKLVMFPAGRTLDPGLRQAIVADLKRPEYSYRFQVASGPCAGLYIDLDGDGAEEFVLLGASGGLLYKERNAIWQRSAVLTADPPAGAWAMVRAELAAGKVSASEPPWKQLTIGSHRFTVTSQP
jgi:Domain of unknown function (DUF4153)